MSWARPAVLVALAVALLLSGCGVGGGQPDRTVTVFAASSLTEVFSDLQRGFTERAGVAVRFSFESSATLAQQVMRGAPVDVFAAANPETMAMVTEAGRAVGEPVTFATNRLVIVVPADNPGNVRRLEDLARPELVVALCAPQVPCGAAAARVLRAAGVEVTPDTYEPHVKAVMTKVTLGEADAGLVYHTDVLAAGDKVRSIEIDEAEQAINRYQIVVLDEARHRDAATEFVAYVRSQAGRAALREAGFGVP